MKQLVILGLLALGGNVALAQALVAPNVNLRADGMPPIEQAMADKVAAYTDFRGYGFVDWHPIDDTMLVRHREAGANIAQIYLLRSAGGPLEKITDFADPVTAAAFEPVHGRSLLYTRDSGGNEATEVFRMDLATRQSVLLSTADERSTGTWSRRGDRVLVAAVPLDKTAIGGARQTLHTTLTLVNPAQPTQRQRLAELPGGGWGEFSFSYDDRWIAALQYRSPNDSDLFLINAATGQRQKLLPKPGAAPAGIGAVAWSRDNRQLFITTNQGSEFSQLAALTLHSQRLKVLTQHIAWDVQSVRTSPDGRQVLAVVNNNGRDEVALFDTASGKPLPRPAVGAGAIGSLAWHEGASHRGRQGLLAYSLNSPQSPGDVYTVRALGSSAVRWTTASSPANVQPATFASPELLTITSFDGLPISAWLYLPDAAKFPGKRPVRVDFHGGPEGQSTVRFMGRSNYLLNEMGVAILLPNVRGSVGYGKTFVDLDNGFKRKDSVKDGGAFLSWIGSHPRLDASRIVVAGGSYGGYMSLATAVDYSGLIRGAIDVVGISHFATFLTHTESYRRDLRRLEYGDEREPAMRVFHDQIAPLNNAAQITVPLFVVQGKNDPRVPYTEAEQIVRAVRRNGVPVWYLLADNEGHGFGRKANADYQFYGEVKFMESLLLNRAPLLSQPMSP